MICLKCGTLLVYDTNHVLVCPRCDKAYWDAETGNSERSKIPW